MEAIMSLRSLYSSCRVGCLAGDSTGKGNFNIFLKKGSLQWKTSENTD
jgi:hypothetical protein